MEKRLGQHRLEQCICCGDVLPSTCSCTFLEQKWTECCKFCSLVVERATDNIMLIEMNYHTLKTSLHLLGARSV
eukprot:scaffold6629_cov171-Skeletonema_dohrnii-CCMP3373.AAC.3